jgi:hypothetical protein
MVTLAVWAIAIIVLIIYIRTGSQVLFHGFNVAFFARFMKCSFEDFFYE